MKKLVPIILLTIGFNLFSQFNPMYNPSDSSISFLGVFTNKKLWTVRDHETDSLLSYFNNHMNIIRYDKFGSSRNSGQPSSIWWGDNDGNMKRSPISELKTSQLTNDVPFLSSETDPNVPSYSKSLTAFSVIKTSTDALYATLDQVEPTGTGKLWFTNTAPTGYLLCDGTAISRSTYSALFALIGTVYGVGDGSTTFNLPDMRQRFPLGKSASGTGNALALTGGTIDNVLAIDPPSTNTGTPSGTSGQLVGVINVASAGHLHAVDIESFNVNQANPPYIVVNFIIKY